jgi:hypothetical protein
MHICSSCHFSKNYRFLEQGIYHNMELSAFAAKLLVILTLIGVGCDILSSVVKIKMQHKISV